MSSVLSAEGAAVGHSPAMPAAPPALADGALAIELHRLAQGTAHVLVVANAYTVCVFQRPTDAVPWEAVAAGEFGSDSRTAVRPLLRGRLLWVRVLSDPVKSDPDSQIPTRATAAILNAWIRDAAGVTGREGDATEAIKDELRYLAAWRCQFSGCGKDLRNHQPTGTRGRFSYFAHIVAASPEGPRGDAVLSRQLASEPTNFLLLCDECHRLIDKIRPADYSVDMLRKMREASIAEIQRLLGTLQNPAAEVVAIVGNITAQMAQFTIDDAHEALWGVGLRSAQSMPQRYFDPGGLHHDVHAPEYWPSVFRLLRQDVPSLQTLLTGTRTGIARPRLAVFPQHATSVMLVAGRILGDTSGVEVFQPHRNRPPGVSRWAWPENEPEPPQNKYKMQILQDHEANEGAAILVIGLTQDVDPQRMPAPCAANGQRLLPTILVSGLQFDQHCVRHRIDLTLIEVQVDKALRTLHDEWRVRTVHLFVCAPAAAVVTVGRKIQARHQADFIVYEALSGAGSPYRPTISITSLHVTAQVSGQEHSVSLQP